MSLDPQKMGQTVKQLHWMVIGDIIYLYFSQKLDIERWKSRILADIFSVSG